MNKTLGWLTGVFREVLNFWQSHRGNRRRIQTLALAFASFSVISFKAGAVTITSGPTFTPASNAPLAGILQVRTDVPTRLSISVWDGTNTWQRSFVDYTNNRST